MTPPVVICRWPRLEYCRQQALLLVDVDWVQFNNASSAAGNNTTAQQHEVLRQRLGGSLPVHFVNSVFICRQPSTVCTGTACLLAKYAEMDPDKAAGYVPAVLSSASDSGRSYGLSVVLPAVLGSVGEWCCLLCTLVGLVQWHMPFVSPLRPPTHAHRIVHTTWGNCHY